MTSRTNRRRPWIAAAVVATLALGSACTSSRSTQAPAAQLSPEEMGSDLELFLDYFESVFDTARLEMEEAARDEVAREKARVAVRQIVDKAREAATDPDPRMRLAHMWIHLRRIEDYLEATKAEVQGDALRSKTRPIALEAARAVNERFERLVHSYLSPEAYAELESEVERHATAERIETDAGELSFPDPSPEVSVEDATLLGSIFEGVTSPFTMFGKVGQSADTFRDLTREVNRFNNLLEVMPQRTALQVRLVLKDMDRSSTFTTAAEGVDRMASVAEEIPKQIRAEGEALLDRLDETQPELRKTIQAAQATVTSAGETLETFDRVAKDMPETVEHFEQAGEIWTATAAQISHTLETYGRIFPTDPDERPKERGPEDFSFPRMTASADAWSGTAREVRGLLAELDAALAKNAEDGPLSGLDAGADRMADRAGSELREVVDHAALRIAQLLGLAFVLGLAFHFIARRRKG